MSQEIFQSFSHNLTENAPSLFWAGLVVFFGILVAKWGEKATIALLGRIRLNQVLKRMGVEETLKKIDATLNAPKFFGGIVKWFFIIFSLMISSEILGLSQFSYFLERVIAYSPNVFVSILIFLVAVFLADFSQKIVIGTLEKERVTYSRLLGKITGWMIWLFATLAILHQLRVTPSLILVIFIGIVATCSIALGIAFGLGGKDLAVKILKELEEKLK